MAMQEPGVNHPIDARIQALARKRARSRAHWSGFRWKAKATICWSNSRRKCW